MNNLLCYINIQNLLNVSPQKIVVEDDSLNMTISFSFFIIFIFFNSVEIV